MSEERRKRPDGRSVQSLFIRDFNEPGEPEIGQGGLGFVQDDSDRSLSSTVRHRLHLPSGMIWRPGHSDLSSFFRQFNAWKTSSLISTSLLPIWRIGITLQELDKISESLLQREKTLSAVYPSLHANLLIQSGSFSFHSSTGRFFLHSSKLL